ncbi:hypothetical protein NE865_05441 [Phthorimaea operculella]|nr:hypothetical protein NE865_05441 [Phthorimaea operculella]
MGDDENNTNGDNTNGGNTDNNNGGDSKDDFSLHGVSIQSRLLPFWRTYPRLWFAHFELLVEPSKKSDDDKFRYVLSVLQPGDLQQVGNILLNPPTANKYQTLKDRLLSVYEESETKQFQKLISGLELGDEKPSQLLRKMRELGHNRMPDSGLKLMWMNQLPAQVRAVLSVSSDSSLDNLAVMADKMLEHTGSATIAAVSSPACTPGSSKQSSSQESIIEALSKQIDRLSFEVAELRKRDEHHTFRSRQHYRSRQRQQSRSRSRSSGRNLRHAKQHNDEIERECRFHRKFGAKAYRCESPCRHKKAQSEN